MVSMRHRLLLLLKTPKAAKSLQSLLLHALHALQSSGHTSHMPFRAISHTNPIRKTPKNQERSDPAGDGRQPSPNEPTAQNRHSWRNQKYPWASGESAFKRVRTALKRAGAEGIWTLRRPPKVQGFRALIVSLFGRIGPLCSSVGQSLADPSGG